MAFHLRKMGPSQLPLLWECKRQGRQFAGELVGLFGLSKMLGKLACCNSPLQFHSRVLSREIWLKSGLAHEERVIYLLQPWRKGLADGSYRVEARYNIRQVKSTPYTFKEVPGPRRECWQPLYRC
jgi:hypothetical protein